MRVIVTRVQPQAAQWVDWLLPHFSALALPLLQTSALSDCTALHAAARQWSGYRAVMFVSSQAVDYFFAAGRTLLFASQAAPAASTRVWGTGPATRAALLAQGLPAHLIDAPAPDAAQFDSEALWQQVSHQVDAGSRFLIVRGDQSESSCNQTRSLGSTGVGRDWLAQRLCQAGASVDFVVAYQRSAPLWSQAERALAQQAASDGSVWLFSSTQALTHLPLLLPGQSWQQARALATHPRIAQAARRLGFARVQQSRPGLADILASIESLA